MRISQRDIGGVLILDIVGTITIGVGDVALREAIHEVLNGGARKILFNLREVARVDASGIGELVSCYTTVTSRGGRLALIHLPAKVSDILQITQLITVFKVSNTEEEAIAWLNEKAV